MATAKRTANRPVMICKMGGNVGRIKPIVKYTMARKTYFIWGESLTVVKAIRID